MSERMQHPRVGIGVMIQNGQGEVLLGLRAGSHGAGEWSFPGGGLDFGETVFECARRETKEETGLTVEPEAIISLADERRYIDSDGKHYLNVGVRARYQGGEAQVLEPDKCREWRWFPLTAVPENLLEGTELILRNVREGVLYKETT